MAQQLPTDYPIDPTVTSGTALADILNRSDEVFNSTNSGPTRPATIKTGGLWAKTGGAALELFMFDGTTDIPIQSGDFGVSTDEGNMTVLGTDGLVYTPLVEVGVSTDADNMTVLGTDGLVYTPLVETGISKVFGKTDSTVVAFTKTGEGSAVTSQILYVKINDLVLTIASGTNVVMPTLAPGVDYSIWVKPDGTLESSNDHINPPVADALRIGGFHYAPGGNATAQTGGNATPSINEYSFWDLKWRPACSDPRGMTLVAGGFWVDIYLTGVDALTNGSSKYNVIMADGTSPPKVPTMFGGNGSTTYGSYTWFEAQEMSTAFGKRTLTQQEFMSAAYGTTEASSVVTDQVSTILNSAYTSKWGVVQATGVLWIWGRDRGGPAASAAWNDNTEGRGSEYNAPNAARFGGDWSAGAFSGSRCSDWNDAASDSIVNGGSRFACDHLQLE